MDPARALIDIIQQGQLASQIALHSLVDGGGGILARAIPLVLPAPPGPGGEQGLHRKQQQLSLPAEGPHQQQQTHLQRGDAGPEQKAHRAQHLNGQQHEAEP